MSILIILHGWQSSKEKWEDVKKLIKKEKIEVIIPDLPGFKEETQLKEVWGLDDYVQWLRRCSSGIKKFFLLGYSFGGRIAIKFASKYPESLAGLILVSAAGLKHKKNLWQRLMFLIATLGKKFSFLPLFSYFRRIFYRFLVRKMDYVRTEGFLKETFIKTTEEDLAPYLSKISVPTLIIWGKKDNITPLSDAYFIKKEIKNSTLEIIEEAGHLINLEAPEKLSEIVSRFIKHKIY